MGFPAHVKLGWSGAWVPDGSHVTAIGWGADGRAQQATVVSDHAGVTLPGSWTWIYKLRAETNAAGTTLVLSDADGSAIYFSGGPNVSWYEWRIPFPAGDGDIDNHGDIAVGHMLAQYRGKPRFESLIRGLVAPLQDLERILSQIRDQRGIDAADGARLDAIGDLIGQAREGADDETYRRRLRARILANAATGLPEEIRSIVMLLVGDTNNTVRLRTLPPACLEVLPDATVSIADAEVWARMLVDAIPAGVRVLLAFDPAGSSQFQFAEWGSDPSSASSAAEWGSDPSSVRALAEVLDGGWNDA